MNSKLYYLYAILALALFLRLLGIWHGYPYSYYPDEAHFVKRALSFGSGDLNPHWFHKPAFFMYVLFFEYGLYFVFGKLVGFWESVDEFAVSFVKNPGQFYLIGRLTLVAFSIGTIIVTFLIGERHFKEKTGLFGALLLTLSYGFVAASQNVKADVPAIFFATVSTFFLLNYVETRQQKQLLFAAMFAGIGTAVKYYPYAMLVPIISGVLLVQGRSFRGMWAYWKTTVPLTISVLVVFFSAFFFCSPYSFLDPLGREFAFGRFTEALDTVSQFFGSADHSTSPSEFIHRPMTRLAGIVDYSRVLFSTTGMGGVISALSLLGLGYLLFSRNAKAYIFLLFPVAFIFVSTVVYPGYAHARHQLPIYPFLAICGGYFIVSWRDVFKEKIFVTVVLLALLIPLYAVIQRGVFVSKEDTRNLAKRWIEANIPAGTKLVLDEHGPELVMSQRQLDSVLEVAQKSDPEGQFTAHYAKYVRYQKLAATGSISYHISEVRLPWWRDKEPVDGVYTIDDHDRDMGNPLRPLGVRSLESYHEDGYEYFVVSSIRYGPFFQPNTERYANFPSFREYYHNLFEQGTLVMEFSPEAEPRPGPTIKIFRYEPGDDSMKTAGQRVGS